MPLECRGQTIDNFDWLFYEQCLFKLALPNLNKTFALTDWIWQYCVWKVRCILPQKNEKKSCLSAWKKLQHHL